MAFFFTKTVRYIIFAAIIYSATQFALRWKSYTISPKVFRAAAVAAQGSSGLSNLNKLRNDLRRSYPSHIVDSGWEAIYGGGLKLQINFLYASPTEFIAVFHAPHKTSGFGGFHWMNSTCTVLNGEVVRSAYTVHGGNKEVFQSGKNFRVGEFERGSYEFEHDTYMACYGRGAVPLSSLWMVTGAISNGDPVSFGKLMVTYTQACFHEIAQHVKKVFNYYKSKALKTEL